MRIRISYKKCASIRFTSALDLHRIWERSFRRALIDVTYSKGFHPQPRIQLGIPLPLGFISLDEKVDIWLEKSLPLGNISRQLEGKIPIGLEITLIQEISNSDKALSTQIQYSDYQIYILDENYSPQIMKDRIKNLLNEKEIIRETRNGKKYDLRPLIVSIEAVADKKGKPSVFLRLLSQQNRTGRADEVMFAMDVPITDFIVERIGSFA